MVHLYNFIICTYKVGKLLLADDWDEFLILINLSLVEKLTQIKKPISDEIITWSHGFVCRN